MSLVHQPSCPAKAREHSHVSMQSYLNSELLNFHLNHPVYSAYNIIIPKVILSVTYFLNPCSTFLKLPSVIHLNW